MTFSLPLRTMVREKATLRPPSSDQAARSVESGQFGSPEEHLDWRQGDDWTSSMSLERPVSRFYPLSLIVFVLLTTSCFRLFSAGGWRQEEADADADSPTIDADADADSDADADADADSDADADADDDADADWDADAGDDGDVDVDREIPGEWIRVIAGTFTMGSPLDEEDHRTNEVQHEVTLTRDYEVQTTEVTQSQFEDVLGYTRSSFVGCADCPAESLTWHEAAAYCNALSDRAGLERCYDCTGSASAVNCDPSTAYSSPYECLGYRLLTEAEWEYAARSGTTGARYGEIDAVAWFVENSSSETHEVGTLDVSPWGFYDMLGNAWEWCHDWYAEYPTGTTTDPWGAETGTERLLRGGSWLGIPRYIRAARRDVDRPATRYSFMGFRVARSLP